MVVKQAGPSRLRQGWNGRLVRVSVYALALHLYICIRMIWKLDIPWNTTLEPQPRTDAYKTASSSACRVFINSIQTARWERNLSSLFREDGPCTAAALGKALEGERDHIGAITAYEYALSHARYNDQDTYRLYERLFELYAQLHLPESMENYARKAMSDCRRSDLLLRLAQWYESQGDLDQALLHYQTMCEAERGQQSYQRMESVDRRLLWPREFPSTYLDEMEAFEAILNDPAVSDDTKGQVHWEMIERSRAILEGCGEELFRREGVFIDDDEGTAEPNYYYATPSILPHPEGPDDDYLILVRLLNYRIDHEGRYYRDYLPQGDHSGVLHSSAVLFHGHNASRGIPLRVEDGVYERNTYRFMGTEDPRLFRMNSGEIRVFWTSWEYAKHLGEGSRIVSGVLDVASGVVTLDHLFQSPLDNFLEKNWVAFQPSGEEALRMVYGWHPLRVGTVQKSPAAHTSHLRLDGEAPTPSSFQHIRGSSSGVFYKGKLWFLVHGTTWHKGPGPTYYHRMVVVNADTLSLDRYTHPFRLETAKVPVEFSLGIAIDAHDRLSIAYSVFDGSAVVRRIPMWKIERLMVIHEKSKAM